jgi:hypothetical protein
LPEDTDFDPIARWISLKPGDVIRFVSHGHHGRGRVLAHDDWDGIPVILILDLANDQEGLLHHDEVMAVLQ